MCKHEEKQCPRCKSTFECKAGTITQCQCIQIKISEALTQQIALQYNDCLCLQCLQQLQQLADSNKITGS